MTNKEKLIRDINNFTTDELADFLNNFNACADCCSKKHSDIYCLGNCSKNIKEWLNAKCPLQEGSLVKIVDAGRMFSTNVPWILDNIDDKDLIAKYAYGTSFFEEASSIFKVIKIVDDKVYIQKFYDWMPNNVSGACYLIGIDGLEEIEEGVNICIK